MSFDHLDLVTVTGQVLTLDGQPAVGKITFDTAVQLVDTTTGQAIFPLPLTVRLDGSGTFTIDLPATDDPDLAPTGWTYQVTVDVTGSKRRQFPLEIPVATAGPLELFLAAPVATSPGVYITRGLQGDPGPTGPTGPTGPAGAAGGVTTVAGRTGAVVLAKADVGLSNVDNTADADKPISTAQAARNATFASLPAATEKVVYVSTGAKANDSNDGLTFGSPKATIAAALTALGSGGGIVRLGRGSHVASATLNATDKASITFEGLAPDYTSIVVQGTVGIDCTGSTRIRFRNVMIYGIGQPCKVGVLLARSATHTSVEFSGFDNAWITLDTDGTANGGAGTIGVYNNGAEVSTTTGACEFSADNPYVATATNIYGITSGLVTHDTSASMSVLDLCGALSLISLLGPALTLEQVQNVWFKGYMMRAGGTYGYAVKVLGLCQAVDIKAQIEVFPSALTVQQTLRGLKMHGSCVPATSGHLIGLDTVGGTTNPGIDGGDIDIFPGYGAGAHDLIQQTDALSGHLGIHNLVMKLHHLQSINCPLGSSNGLVINSPDAAPTVTIPPAPYGTYLLQNYSAVVAYPGVTLGAHSQLLSAAVVPSNSDGNDGDWCLSQNGHVYFKATGAWASKV